MEPEAPKPRVTLAKNLARKIIKELNITTPPIMLADVVNYLKERHEIDVTKWDFGDSTSGIQVSDGVSILIGYNQNQHRNRQRFTVAHELGHFLLGHTTTNAYYDLDSKKFDEVEANKFAGELLMPLPLLKKDYAKNKDVKKLAALYDVSEEALWRQLLECKLI